MDLRFRKAEHLRHPAEFRRVYDRRCSLRSDFVTIYGCPNDLTYTRIGFSVARKVGNAVLRNRLKRLYREAFRLSRQRLPVGLDLVLIPRSGKEPNLEALQETLLKLTTELARKL